MHDQRKRLNLFKTAAFCAAAMLLSCYGARVVVAQEAGPNKITGTVVNAQGELIQNAQISFKEVSSDKTRHVESDERGFFQLVSMPSGIYSITVEANGYRFWKQTGLQVGEGDRVFSKIRLSKKSYPKENIQVVIENFQNEPSLVAGGWWRTLGAVTVPDRSPETHRTELVKLSLTRLFSPQSTEEILLAPNK